jgi:hypothetical protein
MPDKNCGENKNKHLIFHNVFCQERAVCENNVEKYCTAGQATDNNVAHEHCIMDT